jgi:hypothetical protein
LVGVGERCHRARLWWLAALFERFARLVVLGRRKSGRSGLHEAGGGPGLKRLEWAEKSCRKGGQNPQNFSCLNNGFLMQKTGDH